MTYAPSLYTFEAFRKDVKARVRMLNRRLVDPAATWPGVLILDLPDEGLSAEAFELPTDCTLLTLRTRA